VTGRAQQEGGPLFLLDAMSLAFRAYFALPPDLSTGAGLVTNALHGFVAMLVNIVRDHRPAALAVAFDLPGDTFRHEMVEDYKGGRAETPDALLPQFDMIRAVLGALDVPVVEVPGYEADDVLATLATEARDRACDVVVVTGDRDCFQLVEDPHVRVLYNRRGVSDYSLYDEAGIVERTGLQPSLYPLLAAMRGDPSDNLPGVPGIGEKTAAKLLRTYGDLDNLYGHLDALSPKLRENLAAHQAQVRANARAIPLVRDVPLGITPDQLQLGGWDLATVKATFEAYELRTLWRRTVALLAEGRLGPPAPGSERPVLDADAASPPAASTSAAFTGTDPAGGTKGLPGAGPPVAPAPPVVAETVDPIVPAGVADAVAALRSLWPGPGGPDHDEEGSLAPGAVAVAARWGGLAGRSPLRGLALVDPTPPGRAVWLTGQLLEDAELVGALAGMLSSAPLVGHGVKELLRSLIPLGIDCRGLRMDTEVAAYLLDPSTGDYGLGALAGPGTDPGAANGGAPVVAQLSLATGEGSLDGGGTGDGGTGDGGTGDGGTGDGEAAEREVARQAVADGLAVARLVPLLEARLDADGLRELHDDVELPLVRVLARMEVVGIRVDVDELRRTADDLAAQCRQLMAEVHRLAGHEFNVNSTPQLRTVLYGELGLVPGRKTKTGYSTDAATLESLRDDHPIVDTLLRYREVEKLRSTYGESLLAEVAPDGRIHASFRQTVARTGRLSSERPNLHNIPTRTEIGLRFRRAFVPQPGWQFLVADYDQVELRVIAHLSGDPGLVAAFTSGQDIHRTVASGVYGVPAGEVTKLQRDRAKMVSYGLAYGMEAFGLARRLSTSVEEANDIMERYFAAFPSVRAHMETTVAEARHRGFTRTQMGRKRPLPDLAERNYQRRQAAERQAMNAGIQGLAADLFKLALVRLDEALERRHLASRLVLQVHDEVIVEVAPGEEEPVATATEHALTTAVALSVPLEVTMAWGDSWAVKAG
jgi:DNA polymerase I